MKKIYTSYYNLLTLTLSKEIICLKQKVLDCYNHTGREILTSLNEMQSFTLQHSRKEAHIQDQGYQRGREGLRESFLIYGKTNSWLSQTRVNRKKGNIGKNLHS